MYFFSRDLTALAGTGATGAVYGREKVIQQAVTALCQNGKASIVFTGEPGVGKTTVVEGLAQRIASGDVPEALRNTSIRELDTNALVAGAVYHGQFEANLKALLDFLLAHPATLVFMDEMHSMLSISSDANRVSPFATFIKPYLARGDVRMIGATTNREYEGMQSKDAALTRRFLRIDVPEPTRDEAVAILIRVAAERALSAGVTLQQGVVEATVDLSIRHVRDRRLPDKAIELLTGCMGVKSAGRLAPNVDKRRASTSRLVDVVRRELKAIDQSDWKTTSALSAEWFTLKSGTSTVLTRTDIQAFATERFGGIDAANTRTVEKILKLDDDLRRSVIGQERAIDAVCAALKRMLALGRSGRPIGSFLFLGPTGVGKTELCRAVARTLWDAGALLQYNMSEYMDRQEASRLIGSAPGYVGYEEGGRLVRDVLSRPSSVVLFDEIEKAHPDVHNLLLQILEEGTLQDGTGKTCSFSQSLVMLTSNIAADWISRLPASDLDNRYDEIHGALLDEVKRSLRPEIVNRIDHVIVFRPLERVDLERILELLLTEENRRLKENSRPSLDLTPAARQHVLHRGTDRAMGARPLRRALQQTVLTKLADYILEQTLHGSLSPTAALIADAREGEIVIARKGQVSA